MYAKPRAGVGYLETIGNLTINTGHETYLGTLSLCKLTLVSPSRRSSNAQDSEVPQSHVVIYTCTSKSGRRLIRVTLVKSTSRFSSPAPHQDLAMSPPPASRQLISSGSAFEAEIGYSRAVVDGDFVFVSGCTG